MAETLEYTEENIKTLEGVEHIRLRPGMYIGKLGDGSHPEDGIYVAPHRAGGPDRSAEY